MPRDINKVILLGNIASEPKVHYSESGYAMCYFDLGISNNSSNPDKRGSMFVRIIVLGKYVESCMDMFQKKMRVFIEGKLTNFKKEYSGKMIKTVEVIASSIQIVGTTETLEEYVNDVQPGDSDFGVTE